MVQPGDYIAPNVMKEIVSNMDVPPEEETLAGGWEYKIVNSGIASVELTEEQLNLFGQAGWELIHVRPIESAFSNKVWYHFKRKRDDAVSSPE